MTEESESAGAHRRSKVGRVIADRELDGLGEELERYWTGEGEERRSLRELADYFNERVLRSAMADADMEVLDGEVENFYELLTDDDVTGGMRVQAERRLERGGIDPDRLTRDFVSHQAVHTYLTKYRDVERETDEPESKTDKARRTVEQLRNRVQAVTRTSVESLRNAGAVSIGDFSVFVDVRITCSDCHSQYTISELIDEGGCQCD
ncbi:rod-determining factor RdfA [Halorussus sp. AFM4]|uniref:rod-determining factor RdfA n=1 Tax=Halorussus sp. AFM4 TaxID=3421651 RepID=UPI003EB7ED3C